ncbi:GNAT family N-acetyltransferase [uncultured Roseobacter sp.]|uniref:GNAT family N-acetyltransferase n=1 Tax=uncultured Roseobacter sp. TaxID=114847 RepID=UPI0026268378|nr:GNAT family N-acetyltransferase [uncultured Roseobacter sp.]
MDYRIVPATNGFVKQISAIWETGWQEAHANIVPPQLAKLRNRQSFTERALENVGGTAVAIDGTTVLGFCMVKQDELYQMYVSPDARGTGVAQALINEAENRVRANGYATAWLACAVGNERAGRFYEKSGWINTGRTIVELDTSSGPFHLEVWRFEKDLHLNEAG